MGNLVACAMSVVGDYFSFLLVLVGFLSALSCHFLIKGNDVREHE